MILHLKINVFLFGNYIMTYALPFVNQILAKNEKNVKYIQNCTTI